jgi:hypothetical protein
MAARVAARFGDAPAAWIDGAYQLALARPPTDEERRLTLDAHRRLTARWSAHLAAAAAAADAPANDREAAQRALGNVCHALLNSAEMVYVD